MRDIDEAIKYCKVVAKKNKEGMERYFGYLSRMEGDGKDDEWCRKAYDCKERAKEREYLAECLEELKRLKELDAPKDPIYSNFEDWNDDGWLIPTKAVCPTCGYEFKFGSWNIEENHHCPCGQRMRWDCGSEW